MSDDHPTVSIRNPHADGSSTVTSWLLDEADTMQSVLRALLGEPDTSAVVSPEAATVAEFASGVVIMERGDD